jgi:2-methylisocitrate lyase-like PEP mutase family enzyme
MTKDSSLRERALAFRSLHVLGTPLVLPNAWDTASARVVADTGAPALTTSAGLARDLGAADGGLDRDRALAALARIAATVAVPVSADIESGYAEDPAGVAGTTRALLALGAVGVDIEDAQYEPGAGPLRPVTEQAGRIAAARAAADAEEVPLFVNARIDTFLRVPGEWTPPWSGPPPSSPRAPTGSSSPGPSTREP